MRHERGEEGAAEGPGASGGRDDAAGATEGRAAEPAEGVLTLVCLKCGKEVFFDEGSPPAGSDVREVRGQRVPRLLQQRG
jgi:hypothetical protein